MALKDGIRNTYSVLGIRGLLAVSTMRLLGVPKCITVNLHGVPHPIKLRLRTSDVSVYKTVLVEKEYDLPFSGFSPRVIIDAGANIGMASIYYALKYPNARILAIEPEISNFRVLRENVAPYENLTPVNAALWNTDGEIEIGLPFDTTNNNKWAFQTDISGSKVRSMTMSSLLSEFEIEHVDLLKLDIEGAEKEVLESCNWIDRVGLIVVELHDRVKPGCRAALDAAAPSWGKYERGEMTFLSNPLTSRGRHFHLAG